MTISELRAHLLEVLLGVATFSCVFVSCAAVSIALDVHAIRLDHLSSQAQLRSGMFSRIDALRWQFDTFLGIATSASKSMSAGVNQVRIQVEQASQDQKQEIRAATKSTEQVVAQTVTATADAIQQAAGNPLAPIVNVQPAKLAAVAPPQVVVNPVIDAPRPTVVKPPQQPENKSTWRWLRWLWPFHHARAK